MTRSGWRYLLGGGIALLFGTFMYYAFHQNHQNVEPWTISSFEAGPVLVLEPVVVMPDGRSAKPFIEGRGEFGQGPLESDSALADAATRCGAPIAAVDRRMTHSQFTIVPAQASPFYEGDWPLSDLDLVKCIRDGTGAQFRAGIADKGDPEMIVGADPAPFSSLMVERAKPFRSSQQSDENR